MKKYSRFITFGSGLLTFFCFGLPWIDGSSGIELANHGNFIIIALIASLVIIGTSLIKMYRMSVIISSSVGLYCLFLLFFADRLDISIDGVHSHDIQFGASLTAVGFFLAIAGVLDLSNNDGSSDTNKDKSSSETNDEEEDETEFQGDVE